MEDRYITLDFSSRRSAAPMIGMACLFAIVFWFLAAGSDFWASNVGLATAIVPDGVALLNRLTFAIIFALAGSIAGAAVQRSRDIEEFLFRQCHYARRKCPGAGGQ